MNIGLFPLTVCSSDQEPSISVLEQYLTALARSTQSLRVRGSSSLDRFLATVEVEEFKDWGDSVTL